MRKEDCFVSVVAPLADDADIVAPFLEETWAMLSRTYTHFEIVLVDDGSRDDTATVVADLLKRLEFVRLIRLSRRFGREIATLAGLESVIGDFVVVMDPDSDPPRLVPELVARAREGIGLVVGVRTRRTESSLLFRFGARAFYLYVNRVMGLEIPPHSTDFRVLSRQVVNAIIKIKDRNRHLRTYAAFTGFESESFTYEPESRRGAPRERSLREAFALAVDVVVANGTHPLRLVSVAGLSVSALCALYALYVAIAYLVSDDVAPGWTTVSLQIAGLFFVLFLVFTVLCEYVGRLLSESRDRPLYYVADEIKSSVLVDEHHQNVVLRSDDPRGGLAEHDGGP